MKTYKKIELDDSNYAFEFISGQYEGIIYVYKGAVSFKPLTEEEVKLKFDFDVVAGNDDISDRDHFIQTIGDILVEEINESVTKHETIFTGGID